MGTSMREFARLYGESLSTSNSDNASKSSRNKYGAKKTSVDDITFDSKSESEFYKVLLLYKRSGKILDIKLQPKYLLQEEFVDYTDTIHKPIYYVADFEVLFSEGITKVYDSKGAKTKEYSLKKKMLLYRYPSMIFEEVFFHEKHPITSGILDKKITLQLKKEAEARTRSIVAKKKSFL